jgi:CHASE2 domain-containing sensor protein
MNVKKNAVLGAGTAVLLAMVFFKPLPFLENLFYDANFAFSGSAATSGDSVVIAAIDAESISGVGAWPWPRGTIAALIDRLTACSPRVLALDILFPPKREDPPGNDSLSRAFKKVNKLILPFRASSVRAGEGGAPPQVPVDVLRQRFLMVTNAKQLDDAVFFRANRIDASDGMFTASSSQSGVINVTTSKMDQKLREIVHVIKVGDDYFPSFGLCAVASYLGLKPDEFVLDGKPPQVRLGNETMPISSYAGSTLLHFRGRAGTVKTIPAAGVLNGSTKPEALRDKLVFVGVTDALAGADFFITPVGTQFPGVELWATSALDILQKSWVENASGIWTFASLVLVLFLFPGLAIVFGATKKTLSLCCGVAGVILSVAIGLALFKASHCFWDPSPHLYAWVFSVLFIAAQKGVPGLVEYAPFTFDVPAAEDRDSIAAPKEEDFLRRLPQSETASHVARKITITSAPEARRPAVETFSGTLVEEHLYAPDGAPGGIPDGAARETPASPGGPAAMSPEQAAKFGDLCGGRIVKLLGSGGMADVYLVWNPRIEMYRAVKVIKPDQPSNLLARFETEIRILSKLAHPNIVQFFNVGEWYSLPYIEMEFVPGASTEDVMEKCGTFGAEETAAIGIIVCRALDYAHKKVTTIYGTAYKGVVHRDLKPANIMLSKSGRIKLTDFGIARPQNVSLHTMDTGAVVGTLPYLAPEQLTSGSELSAQVDIYALGATLYEFLCGIRAFPQTEIPALLTAKSSGRCASLPASAVPKQLAEIIQKAMAIKPQDRFESAAAMEKALDAVLRSLHVASGHAVLSRLVRRFESKTV